MNYIKNNLTPNEKILYTAEVNPAVFLPAIFIFASTIFFVILAATTKDTAIKISLGIIGIMSFLMTIRITIEAIIKIVSTEFGITNRRIITKTGWIHQNTIEILLPKIESVNIYQNILGRWMNFGNVTITGTGGTKGTFRTIKNPEKVKGKINEIIEHYSQVENRTAEK